MRLIFENNTTLYNTKKKLTRKRDKLKNATTLFLEILFESQKNH